MIMLPIDHLESEQSVTDWTDRRKGKTHPSSTGAMKLAGDPSTNCNHMAATKQACNLIMKKRISIRVRFHLSEHRHTVAVVVIMIGSVRCTLYYS